MEITALSDQEFILFRTMIHRVAGIHLSEAKKALVSGRLSKRIRQGGHRNYGDYFRFIQGNREEHQVAVDLLTTNETYFFREPQHFDFLRETVLPELRSRPRMRVWSAACSSGEEPYTLAMVLAESLGLGAWEILASDISSRVLDKARGGLYPLAGTENIPRPYLVKYCLKGTGLQEGNFAVDPALRERVSFRHTT